MYPVTKIKQRLKNMLTNKAASPRYENNLICHSLATACLGQKSRMVDTFADSHFTWGRNTLLTRFSGENPSNLGGIISELARTARQSDLSTHDGIAACQTAAGTIQTESGKIGVKLAELSPKLDIQKQSMNAGALSLYEGDIPLRNKGSGSKKLISCAMQMKLHTGKNVSLIDELEVGLEPHRIRGLLYKLKHSGQQIFITTHSPVVLRELSVANNELYICKPDGAGAVSLASLNTVSDIQGPVRANADAFLGRKIVACEGPTEIGCLRAYDLYRSKDSVPVWSLNTSYFNCGGVSKIKTNCPQLIGLGYQVAAVYDNDSPEQLSAQDITTLGTAGVHMCQWEDGNSIEKQLFKELPWGNMDALLTKICDTHDTLERGSAINAIIQAVIAGGGNELSENFAGWTESTALRKTIAAVAAQGKWIKRIDYAETVFNHVLPLLPDDGIIKTRLNLLWNWVQNDG